MKLQSKVTINLSSHEWLYSMQYFENITTVEEAHDTYRKWAKVLHPDRAVGASAEERAQDAEKLNKQFQEMKTEYEQLCHDITHPKTRKLDPTIKLERKLKRKMRMTEKQKQSTVHHASKLAGVVAESLIQTVAENFIRRNIE